MVNTTDKNTIIVKLSDLIALDYDAFTAYEAAIKRLDSHTYGDTLSLFKNDHHRHIEVLSTLVKSLGGIPPDRGDMNKILIKGQLTLADLAGDKAILQAMHSNEKQTNEAYGQALEQLSDSSEIQTTLLRHYEDEKKHKAWIENTLMLDFEQ